MPHTYDAEFLERETSPTLNMRAIANMIAPPLSAATTETGGRGCN